MHTTKRNIVLFWPSFRPKTFEVVCSCHFWGIPTYFLDRGVVGEANHIHIFRNFSNYLQTP